MRGVSLIHPMPDGFIFMWGVSLTHLVLASFLCGEFLLHITCLALRWVFFFLFFCFIIIGKVSLTHPMLALFLTGEFLYCFFIVFYI